MHANFVLTYTNAYHTTQTVTPGVTRHVLFDEFGICVDQVQDEMCTSTPKLQKRDLKGKLVLVRDTEGDTARKRDEKKNDQAK